MTNEETNVVELVQEDGTVTKCEVYDIFELDEKSYALLMPLEDENEEESDLIVLEYVEEGEDVYFQNIDDEDEFNKVCEYVEEMMDDIEE